MSQSDLEAAFEFYLRVFGFIGWEREYQFMPTRRFRFDFAFLDAKVAVEIDGGRWAPFGGRHAGDADREKHNLATMAGWRVLRLSGEMIHDARWLDALRGMLG